jgi:hypothetical protein
VKKVFVAFISINRHDHFLKTLHVEAAATRAINHAPLSRALAIIFALALNDGIWTSPNLSHEPKRGTENQAQKNRTSAVFLDHSKAP